MAICKLSLKKRQFKKALFNLKTAPNLKVKFKKLKKRQFKVRLAHYSKVRFKII